MFDHLDDDRPVSPEGQHAVVVARASVLRRRRRIVVAGTCLSAVLAVTAASVALRNSSAPQDLVAGDGSGGVTPTSVPPPEPEAGDPASWAIDPAAPPSRDDSTVAVLVTGLTCRGGERTRVLRPGVVITDSKVEITFSVERPETAPGQTLETCPGTEAVPYEVQLGQPVRRRALVDGICQRLAHIADSAVCEPNDGRRWPPGP